MQSYCSGKDKRVSESILKLETDIEEVNNENREQKVEKNS